MRPPPIPTYASMPLSRPNSPLFGGGAAGAFGRRAATNTTRRQAVLNAKFRNNASRLINRGGMTPTISAAQELGVHWRPTGMEMPGVSWRPKAVRAAAKRGGFVANSGLRYGGAALSGLIGVSAAGNAYSALQNGRIGSALANGAFAVGAGITSYQLAMGEGLMHDHFNRAIEMVGGKSAQWARTLIKGKKNAEWGNRLMKAARWLRG